MINMQRIIYKYRLGVIPHGQAMNIPAWFTNKLTKGDSKIVHIGWAVDDIYIWVDHPYPFEGESAYFQIMCHPTGSPFEENGDHIATVIDPMGFVWHFYEVG
jgi:hypothetical protein